MNKIRLLPDDKVCILRSAQLGDWMVTIPFITYLIYFCKIKKENIYSLVINNKGFNPIPLVLGKESVLSKNSYILNSSNFFSLFKSINSAKKWLPNDLKTIFFLPFSREKNSSVFKKVILSKFLFKIKNRFGFYNTFKEEIEDSQYFSYFQHLGISEIPDKNHIKKFLLEEGILHEVIRSNNKIAIYPNSKLPMKIWPIDNYVKIIEHLLRSTKKTIYLIGGKEDIEYNSIISSRVQGDHDRLINISGKLSVPETIEFLSDCALLVGNDGAPVHMASLANTPVVGLYTFKEPVFSWDPILCDKFITYRTNVNCKHCFKEFCPNPVCLTTIDYNQVIFGIDELLNENLISKQEVRMVHSKIGLSYKSI